MTKTYARPAGVLQAEQAPHVLAWHECETCHAIFPVTAEELRELRAIRQLNHDELPPDDDLVGDVTECRPCTLGACEGCGDELTTATTATAVVFDARLDAEVVARALCEGCKADPSRFGADRADPFIAPSTPTHREA